MPTDPTGLEHLTPVKVRDTSATERASFRKCRRQWFLSVVHRLQSVQGNQNFWLGTLVHAGLEAYYVTLLKRGWRSEMSAAEKDAIHADAVTFALDTYTVEYEASIVPIAAILGFLWQGDVEKEWRDLGELGFEMIAAYFDRERDDPIYDEIVEVERRLMIPIRNPNGRRVGWLSVMTDLVGRRQGYLGVADHKTASREMSAAQLDLDDQLTAEVYAVWMARGEFPEEATYNTLMKKIPAPPKRLKDGKKGLIKLSQDKSQLTTYELYLAELQRHNLSPADYADILDHFSELERTGESPFFKRERVLRSEAQMASFESNLLEEWKDIRAVAAHPERAYPNPSPFSCPSCPVKLICLTIQDDGDVEAIIKAEYVVGDPRR